MKTKQTVQDLLNRLPDDCSLEDILYHLYVLQDIETGMAQVEAGQTIPHEEVVARLRDRWLRGNDP